MTVPALTLGPGIAAMQLGSLAIGALLYARRTRVLARAGTAPVARWRKACFYAGLLALALVLAALGSAGRIPLYAHVTANLLFGELAALLIVLGLTAPLIAPVLRAPHVDRLRILTHPLVALALWTLALYVWHLPALYEAGLRHTSVLALEHAMLLACAINMWMCLLGPLPRPSWFGEGARLLYVLAVCLVGLTLGNILLWSTAVFYPYYLHSDAIHRISPLADQNIAGAVITAVASLLALGLLCWLFVRSARAGEEPRETPSFARSRTIAPAHAGGIALTEAHAAGTIAAERGPQPRRVAQSPAGAREG